MNDVNICPDLVIKEIAHTSSDLILKFLKINTENNQYGAREFQINNQIIKFRVAKTTPKKLGQFVTFWKRCESGKILPYDISDPFDYLIIGVHDHQYFGQFIFPKSVLYKQGFLSKNGKGGKRAMRVYPPWSIPENNQACATQKWQINYFFEVKQSS